MRSPVLTAFALAAATALAPATARAATLHVVADVPTDAAPGAVLLPWDVGRAEGGIFEPVPAVVVPGRPALTAVHRLDRAGAWLIAVAAPSDLGGALPAAAEPRDVILWNGAAAPFFCGGRLPVPVPAGSRIDAAFAMGGDQGDLVVSIDVPTTVGPTTFEPADLARFSPTGGGGCGDWALAGSELDASEIGDGLEPSVDVVGAARLGELTLLAFDAPTDLSPTTGPGTVLPGEIVSWDGTTFALHERITGWPPGSRVTGLSAPAGPGEVERLAVEKLQATGELVLRWSASCSSGAEDHAIYEGDLTLLPDRYAHGRIDCSDDGRDRVEAVTPGAGDRYYLVVPHHADAEGSLGRDWAGRERPAAQDACRPVQVVAPCPAP